MLHRRCLFLLLAICWMVFSLSQIAAQNETSLLIPPIQWFEPNQGQSDSQFAYIAHDRGYTVFLGPTEMAYSLLQPPQSSDPEHRGHLTFVNIHMQLVGVNANSTIIGEKLLPGIS